MILEAHSLWLAQTNAWIISADHKECVLVDVPPDPAFVISRVKELGLRPVAIIATHGHVDHVGGVSTLVHSGSKAQSIATHIHPDDKHMLLDPVGSSPGLGGYLIEAQLDVSPPELIVDMEDGDTVKGAGLRFEVLHTPGHTRGSVCLRVLADDQMLLFSGDHLFRDSIGRTDLAGGSYEDLMESMRTKILPLEDSIRVLPGHGQETTVGRERTFNPFLRGLSGR